MDKDKKNTSENSQIHFEEENKKPLRLNYPQTIKVGFAFAIIILFWSAYDFVVPLLLEKAYGLSHAMRGLVMGLDNLLSLFLLPIFGKISDKSKGKLAKKWGRRTPFIFIGTVLAVTLMVLVPLSAKGQLVRSEELRAERFAAIMESGDSQEAMYGEFYDKAKSGNTQYCDIRYLELNNINTREDFVAIRYYPEPTDGGELSPAEIESNAQYKKFIETGVNVYLSQQVNSAVMNTTEGKRSLIIYMVVLLLVLIAMATFRSPAVALMPDVTPKPLRSQANAIINLAGGAGSAIAFIIYTVALFFENDYIFTIIFATVAGGMLLLLVGFMSLVKERKMVEQKEIICSEYGINDDEDKPKSIDNSVEAQIENERIRKLEKAKFKSFILILASIFMWFMGYNAVSTSLSIYVTKALNLPSAIAGVISGVSMGVSALAFIPVGFLAVKIGRKKSIMLGFALAVLSFVLLYSFVRPDSNQLIPAVLFALFYLLAGFGLIIANVNTFPMVVELAKSEDVGKYTGYYYIATMSAQAITPFIAGLVMDGINMYALFAYAAICVAAAIALMVFVKHGDSKQIPKHKLTKDEKKQIMLDSMGDAD